MIKKISFVTFITVLILTLSSVTLSYSLFESNSSRLVNSNIAKWTIKVNDEGVTNSTFVIDNLSWYSVNNTVASGKAAPGSSSYFDIEIDPSDTEVSIIYEINFDFTNIDNEEIIIDSISELNENLLVRTGISTYTGILTIDKINNHIMHNIRTNIIWNDVYTNNENDYNLAKTYGTKINIPISVDVKQYLGETIVPYIE